jgi:UDP-glucose 4-epimerase
VREFLFASSVKVMGESTNVPWRESDPPSPVDEYGSSKLAAEMALAEVTADSGLHTVALRLPLVSGPGMRANMLRLFRLVDRGCPLPFAAVDNARSILYVGNAAAVFQRMLGRTEGHRVLFAADATPLSTPRLIQEIARVLNRPARLFTVPAPLLAAAARTNLRAVAPALQRLVSSLTVDTSLLQQSVGPLPFQTTEGLTSTASWYLSARRS